MSGNSKRQPSQTPLQERMEKIAVPYGLDLVGRIDKENRMEEVTVSVPLDLLRHIYFALCAAYQKDPDNAQLLYIFKHAKVFMNANNFPPNGKSEYKMAELLRSVIRYTRQPDWHMGEDAYIRHEQTQPGTNEHEHPKMPNIPEESVSL